MGKEERKMKIIYVEADADELSVRPTIMSAFESLINNLCVTFGVLDCSDDETEGEETERKEE